MYPCHYKIKQRIRAGELQGFYFTDNYPRIGKALVLAFRTVPVFRPIRPHRWTEYEHFLKGGEKNEACISSSS